MRLLQPKKPAPPKLVGILDQIDIPGVEIAYDTTENVHFLDLTRNGITHRTALNLESDQIVIMKHVFMSYKTLLSKTAYMDFKIDGRPVDWR